MCTRVDDQALIAQLWRGDGDVDWLDLDAVVDDWLWSGHPAGSRGDISCDGVVNLDDFARFAAQWPEGGDAEKQ